MMTENENKNETGPITLVVPSVTKDKMRALSDIAAALKAVAQALASTNVQVTISHCTVTSSGTGIEIKTEAPEEEPVNPWGALRPPRNLD